MTTLHHYQCPVTKRLLAEKQLEFSGVIVSGVSERYDDKMFTAERTGELAEAIRADGAIVVTDGWGNHHIDFVNVMEQLEKRGIPAIGMSYIGLQGQLVCSSPYIDRIVDFNKNESGYESLIVGDNNVTDYDAVKAIAFLKQKMKGTYRQKHVPSQVRVLQQLRRKKYAISQFAWGDTTRIEGDTLVVRRAVCSRLIVPDSPVQALRLQCLTPLQRHIFVNTNLDFMPIAAKIRGALGTGETALLNGITLMLTGADERGCQPHNIGSSEGFLDEHVRFGQCGTPKEDDLLLHLDVTFRQGQGSTDRGIRFAHQVADRLLREIRCAMADLNDLPCTTEEYYNISISPCPKVVLVKIASGLGNMYETAVFPDEPGGFLGAKCLMDMQNIPVVVTPTKCLDGVIHSLL